MRSTEAKRGVDCIRINIVDRETTEEEEEEKGWKNRDIEYLIQIRLIAQSQLLWGEAST